MLTDYFQRRGIDFNSHPYSMGTFRDIVRNSKKKEKTFKLGYAYKHENEDVEVTTEFAEKTSGIEPVVRSIIMKFTDGKIVFESEEKTDMDVSV